MNPKGNGIDTLKWEKTTCVFFVLVGVEHHWKKKTHTHTYLLMNIQQGFVPQNANASQGG